MSAPRVPVGSVWRPKWAIDRDDIDVLVVASFTRRDVLVANDSDFFTIACRRAHIANRWERIA